LSEAAGADVRLKLETEQPTSSYKVRGAFNAVLRLLEERKTAPPLVTASAGNHGRALAWAAGAAGVPVIVYVPEHAPRTKLEAIRASGATLRPCRNYDEAERSAKAHAAGGEALYVSPYNHADVIAGAGTIALEIHQEWPEVDAIVVPVGGGGLISGIALASHGLSTGTAIIGAEVEASSPFTRSLAANRIVEIDVGQTLADGLAGNLDPDTMTFDIVRREVSRIVTISEAELGAAIAGMVKHEKEVVEGAGAVGVAAVLAGKIGGQGGRVAIVISGANIDQETLDAVLRTWALGSGL
jgi:threonine dehydratase